MTFNFGTNNSATTTTASSTFFGQTQATNQAKTGGFSFPSLGASGSTTLTTSTATTTAPSLFQIGKTNSTTPPAATGTTALTTTTATAKPGLGGTGYSNQTESSNKDAAAPVPVKQQMLPEQVFQLVGVLEGHIKKEKEESSEVAKFSQRQLNKIKENANSLELLIRALKSNLQRENSTVDKLCQTATKLQKNVEMSQRTNDTHAALQHENILPTRYFAELVIEFEQKLTIYRSQIDMLESHLAAGSEISLSELPQTLERLHQTFIALAAGLQIILSHMDKLKQRYLTYRRQVLGDTTDVFQKKKARTDTVIKGPSPFAELSNLSVLAIAQQLQAQQPPNQPPNTGFNNTNNSGGLFGGNNSGNNAFGSKPTTGGFGSGGGLFGNTTSNTGGTTSLFGNTSTTGGGLFGNSTSNTGGSGGLFGNTANNQQKSTFGGFGTSTSTNTGGNTSLFGNTGNKAGNSLFGNSNTGGNNTFSFGPKK